MALIIETPKERFLKSNQRVEAHRALMSHPQFEPSIDAALAQYSHELLRHVPENANDGAGRAFALAGAQEFINVLRNLSEIPDRPKPIMARQLTQPA